MLLELHANWWFHSKVAAKTVSNKGGSFMIKSSSDKFLLQHTFGFRPTKQVTLTIHLMLQLTPVQQMSLASCMTNITSNQQSSKVKFNNWNQRCIFTSVKIYTIFHWIPKTEQLLPRWGSPRFWVLPAMPLLPHPPTPGTAGRGRQVWA